METTVREIIQDTIDVHEALLEVSGEIETVARALIEAVESGRCIYVMGNGGSAADSQHLAAELVGSFEKERDPMPCHALTTDSSILTSVGNDYGVEEVFVRQVRAFVDRGDVVIGISTSGNSPNVLKAMEVARERDAVTIGMTGRDGGSLAELCRHCLKAPSDHTPRIQEAHQTIIHILCRLVEDTVFPD